ncbi:MAG: class I SAM-dependent methyltransferase [Gaiellaceae bacterium]
MSSSAAEFSDSVPGFYDRYLGPVLFEPYAVDLVSRLPTGDRLRVLEIACGTGIVTRRLQESLGDSATLVATDLNEPMLTYARDAVPAPGIVWQQADAQALLFEDGSFDVVVCQFGFMFLPDKVQGFREARRVLTAGGLLLANIWHSLEANPVAGAIHATVARLFPADPPRFMETPYGYHETGRIRVDMAHAGWEDVQLETVRVQALGPSAAELAAGFAFGSPLAHELAERGADPDAVVRALTDALVPVGGERPFKPTLAATVIKAVR